MVPHREPLIKLYSFAPSQDTYPGLGRLRGMIMLLSTETGNPIALLQDDAHLTQVRTAVAGLIAAKYLAPKHISAIGVLGTGEQARMQIDILKELTDCRDVYVWGRSSEKMITYKNDMEQKGFTVNIASTPAEVAQRCNLIVTTTASRNPLLRAENITPGTHITAMGADAPGKIELEPAILAKADIIVVDSKLQCIDHGEICRAFQEKFVADKQLIELGQTIENPELGRINDAQITIADLTGVAVQDIQIAKAVIGY